MSKLTKKFATVSIAVATVASLAGLGVAPVGAVTIAELQASIAALNAQIAAMGGGGVCYTWTRSLYNGIGSGIDVKNLQSLTLLRVFLWRALVSKKCPFACPKCLPLVSYD